MLDLIVTSLLTLVVTLLVVLLRNRRALLTYHVTHDRIGISAHDSIHGEIVVTLGGNQMQNLYVSNIWLVNRSMSDVENLEIKVYSEADRLELMTEQTRIEDSVETLRYTAEYEKIKAQLHNSPAEIQRARASGNHERVAQIEQIQRLNWRIRLSQRWYEVPVLTRGQTIRFTYMTNAPSNEDPLIHVSCHKAGVRVKYKQPYQPIWHLWGVPLVEAGLTGVVIGGIIWVVVIQSISILWLATLLCLIAGLLANIPGAAIVKFYRWIRVRMMG